jgi:hypothetical protein
METERDLPPLILCFMRWTEAVRPVPLVVYKVRIGGRDIYAVTPSECLTLDCGRRLWAADDAEAVFNESAIS